MLEGINNLLSKILSDLVYWILHAPTVHLYVAMAVSVFIGIALVWSMIPRRTRVYVEPVIIYPTAGLSVTEDEELVDNKTMKIVERLA